MTMILYAGTPSDFGADSVTVSGTANLVQFDAVTCDVYLERSTGSTQLDSDSMENMSGAGIDQVSGAAGEVIWFKADDTVTDGKDVFATPDSGTTWYRFTPDNAALVDRVATLEAGGGGGADELDDLDDVTVSGSETTGQVLTWNATTDIATFQTPASSTGVPDGGSTYETLAKESATDGDADWYTGSVPVVPITETAYDALGAGRPNIVYVRSGA